MKFIYHYGSQNVKYKGYQKQVSVCLQQAKLIDFSMFYMRGIKWLFSRTLAALAVFCSSGSLNEVETLVQILDGDVTPHSLQRAPLQCIIIQSWQSVNAAGPPGTLSLLASHIAHLQSQTSQAMLEMPELKRGRAEKWNVSY